jgi:hypothetical protein
VHNLSYDEAALRDNEPYLVIFGFGNEISLVVPYRTLSEAIWLAPSNNSIVELAKVEEVAEGIPVRRPLAMVVDGVWIICDKRKELTMAKVKTNGEARDVEGDLLGVTKPRAKKAAAMAAKGTVARGAKVKAERAPRQPRTAYEDHQRIKKVGDRNTRPESNVGRVISLLKPNMTFGEFSKALEKSKIPFKPSGILSFLVKDGVVQVR